MLIICPNCFAKFEVNDRLLKKNIQKFACSNCGERFEENLEVLRADATEPFNAGAVATSSAEAIMQEQELGNQGRELLDVATEENAVHSTENTDIKDNALAEAEQGQDGVPFNWTNQEMEDLSVQSLPEEFTPVREAKKSKSLWFVFIFLLIVAGILAYAWYQRDDLLRQFPNVQKGIHLIMGKPYASLPSVQNQLATDDVSANAQEADVVQRPDTIVEVQESNVQEPADPTQDIMNESATTRPLVDQQPANVENRVVRGNTPAGTVPGNAPRMGIPTNANADVGRVRPLSMQGGNTDSADDVTLQEIDLNLLPMETAGNPNAASGVVSNTSRSNVGNLENRYDAGQEMPVIIEEIYIDERGEDLNIGAQQAIPEPVPNGAQAPILSRMSDNRNITHDNVDSGIVMGVSSEADTRGFAREAVQKPIILNEVVDPIIENAPIAIQDTRSSGQEGGVQVKDVVFRYDTSLSSRPRLYVQGIVSNMSADAITMPALTIDMFDKDNKLIGTQIVPATSSKLGPNMAEFFFREIEPLPTELVRRVNITAKN